MIDFCSMTPIEIGLVHEVEIDGYVCCWRQQFFLILDEGGGLKKMIGRSPGFDNFKNMVPKIFALLIYEWVRPMKPIEIDGVRVRGIDGY